MISPADYTFHHEGDTFATFVFKYEKMLLTFSVKNPSWKYANIEDMTSLGIVYTFEFKDGRIEEMRSEDLVEVRVQRWDHPNFLQDMSLWRLNNVEARER